MCARKDAFPKMQSYFGKVRFWHEKKNKIFIFSHEAYILGGYSNHSLREYKATFWNTLVKSYDVCMCVSCFILLSPFIQVLLLCFIKFQLTTEHIYDDFNIFFLFFFFFVRLLILKRYLLHLTQDSGTERPK